MGTGFQPRVLMCSECHEEFVFTVAAQQYFAERGYTDDPKRCKACHMQYKKLQRDPNHRDHVHQDIGYPE